MYIYFHGKIAFSTIRSFQDDEVLCLCTQHGIAAFKMLRGVECSLTKDLKQPRKVALIQVQNHREWRANKILWIIWTSVTN